MAKAVEETPEYERITTLLHETKISERQYVRGLKLFTEHRAELDSLFAPYAPDTPREAARKSPELRAALFDSDRAYRERADRNENPLGGHERGYYMSGGRWVFWQPPGN